MNSLTQMPRKIEQVKFPLQEVSRQLAKIGSSGSFATRLTVAAGDLHLEVQGVGRIRFPITPGTARRLCAVARPARHGFKDETRLDQRVRDTWEIAKSRISIDQSRWKNTLAPQLDRICRGLGLPQGCSLKAQLHNMLVYAPGQFFAPHQDSEKTDDMIGTLVMSLPSRFTGGAVSIEHHGAKMRVGGSDKSLTFIAFYADCHHEVHPIKEGYRIVLTYNLVLEHNAPAAGAPTAAINELTDAIREFFATPGQARWSGDHSMRSPPDRLVYLLDHEYTQRGLQWNRLKNSDAQRAIALQEVARELDCEIFLALADVHETWSCEDEYSGYSDYGQRYYGDDDDDADENEGGESPGESSDPELTELIDSDVELRHWLGAGGRWEAVAARVDAAELCYTRPSVDLEPFESEHEGYTGNAGNTVEHWYHRAAVVLWPRERTFVIRAKASPRWGIGEPPGAQSRSRHRHGATAGAILGECHGTDRKACLVRCHSQSRRKAGRSERRRCTAAAVRPRGTEAEGGAATRRPTRLLWIRLVPNPAADMGLGRESRTAANTTLMDGLYAAGPVPNIVRKRLVGGTGTCWLDPLGTVGMVARAVKADSTARLGKGRDARDDRPL